VVACQAGVLSDAKPRVLKRLARRRGVVHSVPLGTGSRRSQGVASVRAECPDHSLRDGIRLGCVDRGGDGVDADTLGALAEVAAVDRVAIPHQMAWLASPGCRLDHLSPYPGGSWIGSHVDMHQLAPTMPETGAMTGSEPTSMDSIHVAVSGVRGFGAGAREDLQKANKDNNGLGLFIRAVDRISSPVATPLRRQAHAQRWPSLSSTGQAMSR
jgi:hypothetical protein